MPLPSLLVRGNLVKKEDARPLDHIMDFISDLVPSKGEQPKSKPRSLSDKVVVLKAGTGSGKSTTIPPELYKRFFERNRKSIAVTQPRVLTAIDLVYTILNIDTYSDLILEKNIGFNTGDYKRPPRKGIEFMTVGLLLQKFVDPERVKAKYGFIVIDEVHERSIELDTLIFLIKSFLKVNWKDPDCPLIILMSATFDHKLFMRYFDDVPESNYFEVKGQSFPIQENFAKYDVTSVKDYALGKALELHEKDDSTKDILIFVHGGVLMEELIEELNKYNLKLHEQGNRRYVAPIKLTSETNRLGGREYVQTFSPIENLLVNLKPNVHVRPIRRIFVATNVAETGVTIDTLKYCIDTGLVSSSEFDPEYACSSILTKAVSQSAARQRRGRVGRKAPGFWYPCYTQQTYDSLPIDQLSQMLTQDLTLELLHIICNECDLELSEQKPEKEELHMPGTPRRPTKKNKCPETFIKHRLSDIQYVLRQNKSLDLQTIDFFESPSASSLEYSLEKLNLMGMITNARSGILVTIWGYYANRFRKISIESIRSIFEGYRVGACILDLITIASFLGNWRSVFTKEYNYRNPTKASLDKEVLMHSRVLLADEFIDCIFLMEEFKRQVTLQKDPSKWCEKQGVKLSGLVKVIQLRDDLVNDMIVNGLNPFYNGLGVSHCCINLRARDYKTFRSEICKLKQCIYAGYRLNLLKREEFGYSRVYRKRPVKVRSKLLQPIVENIERPLYVVCASISLSSWKNKMSFMGDGPISVLDGFVDVDEEFVFN